MDDFEFVKKLQRYLNELLSQDPEQAEAVANSGLLDIVNREFRQGLGPLVAHHVDTYSEEVLVESGLKKFDVFIGAPLTDEELSKLDLSKCVLKSL